MVSLSGFAPVELSQDCQGVVKQMSEVKSQWDRQRTLVLADGHTEETRPCCMDDSADRILNSVRRIFRERRVDNIVNIPSNDKSLLSMLGLIIGTPFACYPNPTNTLITGIVTFMGTKLLGGSNNLPFLGTAKKIRNWLFGEVSIPQLAFFGTCFAVGGYFFGPYIAGASIGLTLGLRGEPLAILRPPSTTPEYDIHGVRRRFWQTS